MVREWFGERLTDERRGLESRPWPTYEHLRDTTREGKTPTLEDFAPVFQAIAHACRAGRHEETFYDVYINRLCRRFRGHEGEYYTIKKLGALSSDLAAVSWFFEKPYDLPVAMSNPRERGFLLSTAAFALSAQGRPLEALKGKAVKPTCDGSAK